MHSELETGFAKTS